MRFLILILILFSIASTASAAELRLESSDFSVKTGDVFEVFMYILPKEERVNAVEGLIEIEGSSVEVEDITMDDSIISAWIQRASNDSLSFSGIVAGGFSGVRSPYTSKVGPGKILTIRMKALSPGKSVISISDPKVLLADGLGSSVSNIDLLPVEIDVSGVDSSGRKLSRSGIMSLLSVILLLWLGKKYIS